MSLRDRLLEALELKDLPRAGWVRVGVPAPESVAAHSWGVAWLVLVLCPEDLDRARALELAVVHDLPEVRAGDTTPHDGLGAAEKSARERRALDGLLDGVPRAAQLSALWEEYEAGDTAEARFVKACDKLDMALQAAAYQPRTSADLSEFVDSALARLPGGLLRDLAGAEIDAQR